MKEYQESALGRETARKYADILDKSLVAAFLFHLEMARWCLRPDSPESRRKHPRMSLQSRAKIFSPFAPLRGREIEEISGEDADPGA